MQDKRIPYDKSPVMWSPDGELVQLSYARRACERGQPALGMILQKNTILLAGIPRQDILIERESKIKAVDDGLFFLPSGLITDSTYLLTQARLINQDHRLLYGERLGPEALTKKLGELMAKHTIEGGLRAFGASVLVAGFERYSQKPKILFLDNGGSYISVKAHASGQDAEKMISYFRQHYSSNLTVEEGKKLAVEAINVTKNSEQTKLEAQDLDIQIVVATTDEEW